MYRATTLPAWSHNNTGRQSAVITTQTELPRRAMQASATVRQLAQSASATAVPCTCSSHTGSLGNKVLSECRLRATASGASPTCWPKLRLLYGARLTPPRRVVCNALTCAGAGQSGIKQSLRIFTALSPLTPVRGG